MKKMDWRGRLRKNLNTLLIERELTLTDVAKETGVSTRQLSNIRKEKLNPNIKTLEKLAIYFEVELWELLK